MSLQDFCVELKVEPGWEDDTDASCVSEALAALYAGHVIKEELVLGPESLQPAAVFELRDLARDAETHLQASLERTCSVRLEHIFIDMEEQTYRIGGKTYKFRWCFQKQGIQSEENSRKTFKEDGQLTIKNEAAETSSKKIKPKLKRVKGLNSSKYYCNECQYSTKHAENLLTHLSTHAGEKPFKCSKCSSTFLHKRDLKTHKLRKHDGERPFKCSQCSSAFVSKGDLKSHNKRSHSSEKPFQCNQCSSSFVCKTYLKVHLRIHSGEKLYKCDQCSIAFVQRCHLARHLKTHTDVKPYECNQCNAKFKDRWSSERHKKTHKGKKGYDYRCKDCGAAFNQSCNLLRHQRIHTGEKKYKCSYCDASFVQKCDLGKHLKIHSSKGRFECNFCVYKTTKLNILKVHINKWHSGQKSDVKIEV